MRCPCPDGIFNHRQIPALGAAERSKLAQIMQSASVLLAVPWHLQMQGLLTAQAPTPHLLHPIAGVSRPAPACREQQSANGAFATSSPHSIAPEHMPSHVPQREQPHSVDTMTGQIGGVQAWASPLVLWDGGSLQSTGPISPA